jgi:hypothetical protein
MSANPQALPADTARLTNVLVMHPVLPPMAKAARPGSTKESYSVEAILVEGSVAHKAAIAAQEAAIVAKWPGQRPANLKLALKDPQAPSVTRTDGGPARRGVAYENEDGAGKRWYLRAASQFDFPCWVGREKLAARESDIYSGGVWLLVVKFAAYSSASTGHGVTCYLQLAWRTSAGRMLATGGGNLQDLDVSDVQFDDSSFDESDNPF